MPDLEYLTVDGDQLWEFTEGKIIDLVNVHPRLTDFDYENPQNNVDMTRINKYFSREDF